jgi:hypothetical protein
MSSPRNRAIKAEEEVFLGHYRLGVSRESLIASPSGAFSFSAARFQKVGCGHSVEDKCASLLRWTGCDTSESCQYAVTTTTARMGTNYPVLFLRPGVPRFDIPLGETFDILPGFHCHSLACTKRLPVCDLH